MTKEEAIKFLQQIYPNGGHCWLDEQRIEAINMAIDALKEEPTIPDIVDEHFDEMLGEEPKECMYSKDHYTDEDRKVLCDGCEEECKYAQKEEPVSEFMNIESMIESYKQRLISQANGVKNSPLIDMCLVSYKHGINETLDTLNLSNVQRTVKNWKEPVSEEFEKKFISFVDATHDNNGSYSLHDFAQRLYNIAKEELKEPISEDLEEACEQLAESARKHKAETSSPFFSQTDYKLGFKDGAKWQKEKEYTCYEEAFEDGAAWKVENLWKPADGDDLPEIDREVIALLDNGKVVFAHRPPEYWDGKNIVTGKVTRNYPKTYDKGGWNIPNIVYWLNLELPKEKEG